MSEVEHTADWPMYLAYRPLTDSEREVLPEPQGFGNEKPRYDAPIVVCYAHSIALEKNGWWCSVTGIAKPCAYTDALAPKEVEPEADEGFGRPAAFVHQRPVPVTVEEARSQLADLHKEIEEHECDWFVGNDEEIGYFDNTVARLVEVADVLARQ